ncbi:MAG: hypothetical protein J6Q22_10925 [Prevotella sp.]|nr:hypothetical protein [Prevotella sp.]
MFKRATSLMAALMAFVWVAEGDVISTPLSDILISTRMYTASNVDDIVSGIGVRADRISDGTNMIDAAGDVWKFPCPVYKATYNDNVFYILHENGHEWVATNLVEPSQWINGYKMWFDGTNTWYAQTDEDYPTSVSIFNGPIDSKVLEFAGFEICTAEPFGKLALTNDIPFASDTVPLMDGTGYAGISTSFARSDHVHPSDVTKVNKAGDMMGPLQVTNGNLTVYSGNLTVYGWLLSRVSSGTAYGANMMPTAFRVWDSTDQTEYQHEKIEIKHDGNTYSISIPRKSGTFALTNDIPDVGLALSEFSSTGTVHNAHNAESAIATNAMAGQTYDFSRNYDIIKATADIIQLLGGTVTNNPTEGGN